VPPQLCDGSTVIHDISSSSSSSSSSKTVSESVIGRVLNFSQTDGIDSV